MFRASLVKLARFPPLQVRISKNAHQRNLAKIQQLKRKPNYVPLGREKRTSPTTERASSTKETQVPIKERPILIQHMLASPTKLPKDLDKESAETVEEKIQVENKSIRMPSVFKENAKKETKLELKQCVAPVENLPVEPVTKHGPFYKYSINPKEAQFIFEKTPKALQKLGHGGSNEQTELVRRVLSLELANKKELKKFNIERVKEVFQLHDQDTGSSCVQAAALTVRIEAMKDHLKANHKDKSTKRSLEAIVSRRKKVLKYLRSKDLKQYVETCHLLGVEP